MSKAENSIISIPLENAPLNLNQEQDSIRQFEGFNKNNAPFYGGNLTPLWKKELGDAGDKSYIKDDENTYTLKDGKFYLNYVSPQNPGTLIKGDFQTKTCTEKTYTDRKYVWFYDENNFGIKQSEEYIFTLNGSEVLRTPLFNKVFYRNGIAVIITGSLVYVFKDGVQTGSWVPMSADSDLYYKDPSFCVYQGYIIVDTNGAGPNGGLVYAITSSGAVKTLVLKYRSSADLTLNYSMFTYNIAVPHTSSVQTLQKVVNLVDVATDSDLNNNFSQEGGFPATIDGQVYQVSYKEYLNSRLGRVVWCPRSGATKDGTTLYTPALTSFGNANNIGLVPSSIFAVETRNTSNIGYWYRKSSTELGLAYYWNAATNCNWYKVNSATISGININAKTLTVTLDVTKIDTKAYSSSRQQPWTLLPIASQLDTRTVALAYFKNSYGNFSTAHFRLTAVTQTVNSQMLDPLVLGIVHNHIIKLTYTNPYGWSDISTSGTVNYSNTWSSDETLLSSSVSVESESGSYDPMTNRGFAYNFAGFFRLLLNNGVTQAISMYNDPNNLGTLVSSWALSDIEYVYADNNRLVYTDSDNIAHELTVKNFSEVGTFQVVNKYLVFNAIGENCYNLDTGDWSRAGIDWNNRFFVGANSGTKYFVSSQVKRTTDSTPMLSMFFGADYINKISIGALTPQYAKDGNVLIQMYGAEEVNENCLYRYSYSWNGSAWVTSSESAYEGTVAETQTDGNFLIPVNLFTSFVMSYLNDVYAILSNGFAPLYINNNSASILKMNYYLGTVVTDVPLDNVFIIQGQYYRIGDGIIYSYSYSQGVESDVQQVCNIGSLKLVGTSPESAFFWSFANRTLYEFSGARTVSPVYCADSISVIYGSHYDTTTSSLYLSTNKGLLINNSFGTFLVESIVKATDFYSTQYGIVFTNEARKLIGLYYNAENGEDVIPIELETAFYGFDHVKNMICDTLYVKVFNKDHIPEGKVKVSGYVQENYGSTKGLTEKVVTLKASQFDEITNNVFLRFQPGIQRGIGVSWKISSDFPISLLGVSAQGTNELNLPKGNSPVNTSQKYNF